jgi:N-acetylmuramoyl-L-alanine amidase
VGIVAGHHGYDSGAVCPDGLQEASINLDVASRVVAILQFEGYDAELLSEFDDKLPNYQADAFVSIHSDSCVVPDASGFKVARVARSAIPEEDDRLLQCVIDEYQAVTHLDFHENSITFDMTGYHAFHEIHPQTPAIIIELGFMAADRDLLTNHSYELAQGVVRGVSCFLDEPD